MGIIKKSIDYITKVETPKEAEQRGFSPQVAKYYASLKIGLLKKLVGKQDDKRKN